MNKLNYEYILSPAVHVVRAVHNTLQKLRATKIIVIRILHARHKHVEHS